MPCDVWEPLCSPPPTATELGRRAGSTQLSGRCPSEHIALYSKQFRGRLPEQATTPHPAKRGALESGTFGRPRILRPRWASRPAYGTTRAVSISRACELVRACLRRRTRIEPKAGQSPCESGGTRWRRPACWAQDDGGCGGHAARYARRGHATQKNSRRRRGATGGIRVASSSASVSLGCARAASQARRRSTARSTSAGSTWAASRCDAIA